MALVQDVVVRAATFAMFLEREIEQTSPAHVPYVDVAVCKVALALAGFSSFHVTEVAGVESVRCKMDKGLPGGYLAEILKMEGPVI